MKKFGTVKHDKIFQNRFIFICLTIFLLIGLAAPAFSISGAFKAKGKDGASPIQFEMENSNLSLGNFVFGSNHFVNAFIKNEKNELEKGGFPLAKIFVPGLLVCFIVSFALAIFMIVPIKGMDKSVVGRGLHYILPGVLIAVCAGLILYYSIGLQKDVMQAIKILDVNHAPGALKTTTGVWPILNCLAPLAFIGFGMENTFKNEVK